MVNDAGDALDEGPTLPNPYTIDSISSILAPAGLPGSNWYRYEISQGSNRIVGYRQGTAVQVREVVEVIVAGLNTRRIHRRGRVQVVLGKKPRPGVQPLELD